MSQSQASPTTLAGLASHPWAFYLNLGFRVWGLGFRGFQFRVFWGFGMKGIWV